jgi:site-specific DNA recombinase
MRDLDISYLRVSTQRQREEETIETQRFILDRYFEQYGISMPDDARFEDDGVSGGIEVHKRPAGKIVYNLVASGRVRRLFLFHSDRVGRDTIDTLLFHRLAENNGTQIIGIAEGTDTFREGSNLTTEMRAVIAAELRRDCSRRTKAGLRRRISQGKITTRAPFGYRVESGFIVQDEPNISVMGHAFREVARGVLPSQIVAELNKKNSPSPTGQGWRHDTLIKLLHNRAFMGEFVAFRTPKRNPKGGRRIPRDPKEHVIVPCPAVVSRELFDLVQERLAFNRRFCATSQKRAYLLKGLIRCAKCERTYIGHAISGRKYKDKCYPDFIYYQCGSRAHRDYDYCGSPQVNARKLESAIWTEIEGFLYSPASIVEKAARRVEKQKHSEMQGVERKIKRLKEARAKNYESCTRLALAVARGVLSEEETIQAKQTLSRELAAIEEELTELSLLTETGEARKERVNSAQTLLETLRQQVDRGFSPQKKTEIVRCLVKQIKVYSRDGRPRAEVQYVFPCLAPQASALKMSLRKKSKARPR